jgi:hypothetical protein
MSSSIVKSGLVWEAEASFSLLPDATVPVGREGGRRPPSVVKGTQRVRQTHPEALSTVHESSYTEY